MANNRMWLRCTVCNEHVMLAKYYPTITNGWFVPIAPGFGDPAKTGEAALEHIRRVEQFLQDHSFCGEAGGIDMWGNRRFEIEYEVPEEIVEEPAHAE